MSKPIDTTDYDALALRAERGELKRLPSIYKGDGQEIDLADIFLAPGRPRGEDNNARTTWKTRAPEDLDLALAKRAQEEDLTKSALIRKAVKQYLELAYA